MHDALPLERLGEPSNLVHQPPRRDGRVIRKGFVSDVDELEHGLGAWIQGRTAEQLTARRGAVLRRLEEAERALLARPSNARSRTQHERTLLSTPTWGPNPILSRSAAEILCRRAAFRSRPRRRSRG